MVNIASETQSRIAEGRLPTVSLRAVVAPEFLQQTIPLREAWVGTLKDKRHISSAIRHLARVLPAPISVDNSSPPALPTVGNETHLQLRELEDLLGSVGNDFDPSNLERDFEIVRVPASAPRTKAQASAASKIWPLNFHPDPHIERTLSGSCFAPKDLLAIDRCVELCIEAARREARGNEDCTGSAIIFDPKREKIVAIAASRIDLHPMWHAAILVVDLVARLQGGGAYDLTSESVDRRKRKYTGSRPELKLPVAFPAGLMELARRDGASTSGCENRMDGGSEYLCTNYWAFLLREPCPLCAMALVHSRVSEIFWGAENESRGVLGSRALLHAVPGLNHRYRVWRGVREEECRRVCNEIIVRR